MWVQYYDETSTAFVINTDDTCTIPELEDKQTSGALYDDLDAWQYRLVDKGDDIDVDDTTASLDITGDTLDSGAYRGFIFSAANNQGSLDFEYEVPSWFKYNWLGDSDDGGEYIDNPTGIITFGRYRGNDRIISWQEIEN